MGPTTRIYKPISQISETLQGHIHNLANENHHNYPKYYDIQI